MGDDARPPSDDLAHDLAPEPPGLATSLLRRAAAGDGAGQGAFFELVFGELHALAGRAMAREGRGHTLQPTALVNEVWLKLFSGDAAAFADRGHFLIVAARAMRQVLVDHARTRKRLKRGGAFERVDLDALPDGALDAEDDAGEGGVDLVQLDVALDALRAEAPRPATVVELKYFAGLEVDAIARALDVSPSTVAREWRFARAWLSRRMERSE